MQPEGSSPESNAEVGVGLCLLQQLLVTSKKHAGAREDSPETGPQRLVKTALRPSKKSRKLSGQSAGCWRTYN